MLKDVLMVPCKSRTASIPTLKLHLLGRGPLSEFGGYRKTMSGVTIQRMGVTAAEFPITRYAR